MSSPPPSVFTEYLSPDLQSLLSNIPPSIPFDSLSRTATSRLQQRAFPNLSLIELVSSADFATLYDPLYVSSFPKQAERERSDLIVDRLAAQARGERRGLAPYRIVGIRDPKGEVIGAAQFSVLPVPPRTRGKALDGTAGAESMGGGESLGSPSTFRFAVPYLQYIYVRAQNRRQDMSEVLHTMVVAVATADAAIMQKEDGEPTSQRTVPFTLFETEPPDHGDDHASRAYALERSKIHTSSGGVAVVLRRRRKAKPPHAEQAETAAVPSSRATTEADNEDEILSAHVQPGLEPRDPPLSLVWMIRPSPTSTPDRDYNLTRLGKSLIAAYYQSLRDEGFPEKNIQLAERIIASRYVDSEFELMPLADVKDFSMEEGFLDIQ
jgi:hypothetical protein